MSRILALILTMTLVTSSWAQTDRQKEAREQAEKGNLKEAVAIINEVIKSNPPKATYYHDKANYLLQLKDYEGTLKTLGQAIEIMPDSSSLYDMRGTLLEAFRLYDEAIRDFTLAYERAEGNKTKSHLLSNRGGTKIRFQDYKGAYTDLVTAIELDPENIDALNNMAAICDEIGKPNETLVYLEKIISINPKYVPAYVNIGFRYQKLEQHQKAIEYFNKAIELDPNEGFAYSNRSFSKLKTKDLAGAMQDIDHSLTLEPLNSYGFKIRALILIEKGNVTEACANLKEAAELGYERQYGNEVKELMAKNCKD